MKAGAGIVRRAFRTALFSLIVAAGIVVYPRSAATQTFQDRAAIMVAFVTDSSGKPIAGADVQIVGTSLRGSTDEDGRVALLAVPAGKAILKVRRLGFAELTVPISVTPGAFAETRYKLMPVKTNLGTVTIRADLLKPARYAKTQKFDEFYRRRSQGIGTFFTREIIDARQAQRPEDLLRLTTGIRITYRGSTPLIKFARCDQVEVYIDGVRSHDGFRDFFAMNPLEFEAMEIYHGVAQVPPEFSPRPNDCAAIVIWTRWHGAQQ